MTDDASYTRVQPVGQAVILGAPPTRTWREFLRRRTFWIVVLVPVERNQVEAVLFHGFGFKRTKHLNDIVPSLDAVTKASQYVLDSVEEGLRDWRLVYEQLANRRVEMDKATSADSSTERVHDFDQLQMVESALALVHAFNSSIKIEFWMSTSSFARSTYLLSP